MVYMVYNVAESNSISVDELKYFLMPGWGKHQLVQARTNENSFKKILWGISFALNLSFSQGFPHAKGNPRKISFTKYLNRQSISKIFLTKNFELSWGFPALSSSKILKNLPDTTYSWHLPFLRSFSVFNIFFLYLFLSLFLCLEPITEVVGGPELHINKGSTINLTCIVKFAPEPPPTVVWSHNRQVSLQSLFLFALPNTPKGTHTHSDHVT